MTDKPADSPHPEHNDHTPNDGENGIKIDKAGDNENDAYTRLHTRLTERTAIIGVIGLGYVGLPLAHLLHSSGLKVIGFDTDSVKITKLRNGQSYIHHIPPNVTTLLSKSPTFTPTTDVNSLSACDALIMCLPTPVGPHNEPDMSYVLTTTHNIAKLLNPEGRLIVLQSTTYPGATDTDIAIILEKESPNTCKLSNNIFLAFSPEREDPGNIQYQTKDVPKLIGGTTKQSTKLACLLYKTGGFQNPISVSSARVAECAKLLENTYRAVNIALVNEMKQVFTNMNVNIWEVLQAANTKPFGYQRFDPGPGIGGHCIPIDPFYLTWKAKETNTPCSFIELATKVNENMPNIIISSIQNALNDYCRSINGSNILILGIAYKPNVDDIREAPALVIWEILLNLGSNVSYYDPFVPIICPTRKHMRLSEKKSINENDIKKGTLHAVLLITHHDCFEGYSFLKGFKGPVIDTRNRVPKTMGLNIILA